MKCLFTLNCFILFIFINNSKIYIKLCLVICYPAVQLKNISIILVTLFNTYFLNHLRLLKKAFIHSRSDVFSQRKPPLTHYLSADFYCWLWSICLINIKASLSSAHFIYLFYHTDECCADCLALLFMVGFLFLVYGSLLCSQRLHSFYRKIQWKLILRSIILI